MTLTRSYYKCDSLYGTWVLWIKHGLKNTRCIHLCGSEMQVSTSIVMTYWISVYLIPQIHGSHKASELISGEVQNLLFYLT